MTFYLPDFYNKLNLNLKICELKNEHPEYFYDNIKIGAIYGSFPGMIWNGGRCIADCTSKENIDAIMNAFELQEAPLRFTMTNCLLTEKELYNKYCNMILEMGHKKGNGVIVNSILLENYIREKYPLYSIISSTTKCQRDIQAINQEIKKYDMIVTDYRDNSNFEFLKQITDKNKVELLINAYCSPNCPVRPLHYALLSKDQLNKTLDGAKIPSCNGVDNFYDSLKFTSTIKQNQLSDYVDMGFTNFKIEGRLVNSIQVIESYVYYLIKPEFQNKIRILLLQECL